MSAIRTKFYNLFWTNPICRKIFSVHKEQLLEKSELDLGNEKKTYYLQKIVLSNNQKQKVKNELISSRIENRNVDLNNQLLLNSSKYFDEAKFQAQIEKYFGKAVEKIGNKLKSGTFSQVKFIYELMSSLSTEEKLIQFLRKYHLISDNITSFAQIEEILNKTVSNLITKESIIDIIDSVDKVSEMYTNLVYDNLFESNKFFMDLLYDDESFKERQVLFDLLYESKIIESGIYKTYYECYNCEEGVFKSISTLKAKPSKISLKCPVCNKETYYMSPYKINDEVFAQITDKDGLLKYAIQNLLESKGLACKVNFIIPPDIEVDFVVFGDNHFSAILELKMFKTNTPTNTQKSNLKTAITQTSKIRHKVVQADVKFGNSYSIIIVNYTDKDIFKEVRDENKLIMKENRIKLFSIDEFKDYIENEV